MPRIELPYLIRPTTTPAQEILLNHFYTFFDNGSAAKKRITNVQPLYYAGAIAGTEFLTYADTKMYICYNFFCSNITNHGEVEGNVSFYNEANTLSVGIKNQNAYWEADGRKDEFCMNPIELKDFYFSRFTVSIYTYMVFNGYRITLL